MERPAASVLTFRSRITRRQWWLGIAAVSGLETLYLLWSEADYFIASVPSLNATMADLVFLVPVTALLVKRCNDRDWPWWMGYALPIPIAMFIVADYFGFFADDPNNSQTIVLSTLLAVIVIVVIDNGFLRGTVGANRYGPDPLEPSTSPPQS